ncbi:MAG: hypothetical protein KBD76_03480 [Bacteriovorax sp.]|jgi:hypothetical protein|nr:hypothetical protein [Bacteriovorax sp.]
MSELYPKSFKCYNCLKDIPVLGSFKVTRTEDCPYCTKSLHCCKMCKFYDPKVYNECHEMNADRIVDKEKANFCDYFTLSGSGLKGPSKEELLNSADALFKK